MPVIAAKSMKVTVPIADGSFPTDIIPAKGSPGSASAKVSVELNVERAGGFVVQLSAKTLQRAKEGAEAAPGGHWVLSGKLGPGNEILEAGVVYQAPIVKKPTEAA